MGGAGIIWSAIICIPFWIIIILLVKAGIIAMETIIFVGLVLSGLLLFIVLSSSPNTKRDEQEQQFFSSLTKVRPFLSMQMELKINDNGGNRTGIDRRMFEYSAYIPERRSGIDRRKGFDRRDSITSRRVSERRNIFKIRI